MGSVKLSITLGAAIGPFLGIFLLNHGGYIYIFSACTVAAFVALVATFWMSFKTSLPAKKEQRNSRIDSKYIFQKFFEMKALPISLICAGIYFSYSSIITFLAPYAENLQLQEAAAFFFVVYSLAILLTRPFTGQLFDRCGANIVMIPAFLSFMSGMLLLGNTVTSWMLLSAAILLDFGIGIIQSCGLTIAVQSAPKHRLSYVNSTFYFFIDMGTGIGPFTLGAFVPQIGYRDMYESMALLSIVCCIFYLVLSHKKKIQPSITEDWEEEVISD